MRTVIRDAGACSDVGRLRQSNEDALLLSEPVFAVADGMGGARAGEVASAMAVAALHGFDGGEQALQAQRLRGAILHHQDLRHRGAGRVHDVLLRLSPHRPGVSALDILLAEEIGRAHV